MMVEIDDAIDYLRDKISCDSGDSDFSQYVKFGLQLSYLMPFGLLYLSFMIAIVKRRGHHEVFEDSFFALHLVDGAVVSFQSFDKLRKLSVIFALLGAP